MTTAPDIFRGVLISLAALLVGIVLAGAYQAWRDRYLPVPKRLPLPLVLTFLAGYVLLLCQLVVDRWVQLGNEVTPSAWVAMLAVLVNAVAMLGLVIHSRPGPDLAERHARFHRTVELFRESLSYLDTLNQMNWEKQHKDGELPHTRYVDSLVHLDDAELEQLLRVVSEKRGKKGHLSLERAG